MLARFALVAVCALGVFLAASRLEGAVTPVASTESGWPQFRGPRRDGVSSERGLLAQWPQAGPRALWSATNLGRGFSAPVISEGRLIVTGDFKEGLILCALDLNGH